MLNAVVTDLNEVAEAFRPAYTARDDGKFQLQVTAAGGLALEDTTGLRNALNSERTLKEQATASLKAFDGIDAAAARQALTTVTAYGDITPDKAKQLATDYARLAALDPAKEADKIAGEKILAEIAKVTEGFNAKEATYQGEVTGLKGQVDGYKAQLRTLLVSNQLKTELAALKPVEGGFDMLEMLAEKRIRTTEKDGKFVVEVLDAQGNVDHKMENGSAVPKTVADLALEIREQRPAFFEADQKSGTGITPANPSTGGATVNPWAKATWNRTEQAKITNSDPNKAKSLKAQAGIS